MNSKEFYKILTERGADVRAYSGRFMFGKRCIGVSIDSNAYGLIAECVAVIEDEQERLELVKIFRNTKEDSLGLGSIIYWPNMLWDSETMDECCDDEDDY